MIFTAGKEFGFWTDQNWTTDSVIVLSPFSKTLKINRTFATVDDIRINGKPRMQIVQ